MKKKIIIVASENKGNRSSEESVKQRPVPHKIIRPTVQPTNLEKTLRETDSSTKPSKTVSTTWEDRPKSYIIKWMMEQSGIGVDKLAEYLGFSKQYFNNKLSRDSFSFDDLLVAAYACGYSIAFNSNDPESRDSFEVNLKEYFQNYDEEVLERIEEIKDREKKIRRMEYEKMKEELERMKTEYGFED